MKLKIPGGNGRRQMVKEVADFAAASAAYCYARDKSGEGQSTFGCGEIFDNLKEEPVAFISYNGKVWRDDPCRPIGEWNPNAVPLFNPYA
jgi:hypothetical protein